MIDGPVCDGKGLLHDPHMIPEGLPDVFPTATRWSTNAPTRASSRWRRTATFGNVFRRIWCRCR